MRKVREVRVRPVTRYVVTVYESGTTADGMSYGQCETVGEFDNERNAETVATALRAAAKRAAWESFDDDLEQRAFAMDPSESDEIKKSISKDAPTGDKH